MKIKKIIISFGIGFALLAFVFCVAPYKSQALTVSADVSIKLADLKQQLSSLLKQVEDVRKQIKEIETNKGDFCFTFNESFGIGARGSQVVALHSALAREGFGVSGPEGQFNEETGASVTGFQEKYRAEILASSGLKFGTGYVGVATRAKLNALYGCAIPAKSLKVLNPNGGESWKLGSSALITWQEPAVKINSGYDVYLDHWYVPCKGMVCPMYPIQAPYTIVKGVYANNYQWTVGSVQDSGREVQAGYYVVRVCVNGTDRCDSSNDKFNIYDTPDTGNKPPVISGFEAPTRLKVGTTGTWKVSASDPENGSLSYSILWGDETAYAPNMGSTQAREFLNFNQSTTFTHSFSSSGEYKVRLTVRDSSGGVAETSATTVVVGEDQVRGMLKVRVLNGNIVCITTPCEFPLVGATVEVREISGLAILRTGVTDSDGYFTTNDLKAYLSYPVRVVRGGYATQEVNVYINPGSNTLTVRLQAYPPMLQTTQ